MFAALDIGPPHGLAFKGSPDTFAEIVERADIVPAPNLARAMWVEEEELGEAPERRELEGLLKSAYDLLVAKLPASRRPRPGKTNGRAPRRRPVSKATP